MRWIRTPTSNLTISFPGRIPINHWNCTNASLALLLEKLPIDRCNCMCKALAFSHAVLFILTWVFPLNQASAVTWLFPQLTYFHASKAYDRPRTNSHSHQFATSGPIWIRTSRASSVFLSMSRHPNQYSKGHMPNLIRRRAFWACHQINVPTSKSMLQGHMPRRFRSKSNQEANFPSLPLKMVFLFNFRLLRFFRCPDILINVPQTHAAEV
jgi:hypothetical protein